ncbi:hypothetical protein ACXN5S_11130 [Pseudoroseicyclus sp. H15]
MNKAIEHIYEIDLHARHLERLSVDEKAFLAVISYGVSELNALSRIHIFSYPPEGLPKAVEWQATIQRHTILRCWAAKIFELFQFLESSYKERLDSQALVDLLEERRVVIDELKADQGFALNRLIRDQATNHYSLSQARKTIRSADTDYDARVLLHDMDGNCCFPMGEEIVFAGRLSSYGKGHPELKDPGQIITAWLEWALKVSKAARSIHARFFENIMSSKTDRIVARQSAHYIDINLTMRASEMTIPIYLRREE